MTTCNTCSESWKQVTEGSGKGFSKRRAANEDAWRADTETPLTFFFDTFYSQLHGLSPHTSVKFAGKNGLKSKAGSLIYMISVSIDGLKSAAKGSGPDYDATMKQLNEIATGHAHFGVRPSHYAPVVEALLNTLQIVLEEAFTPEVRQAWIISYSFLLEHMVPVAAVVPRQTAATPAPAVVVARSPIQPFEESPLQSPPAEAMAAAAKSKSMRFLDYSLPESASASEHLAACAAVARRASAAVSATLSAAVTVSGTATPVTVQLAASTEPSPRSDISTVAA